MRLAVTLSALMLIGAGASRAADEQAWGFVPSDGDVRLFYGVPDSGSLTISFICEFKRKRIVLVSTVLPSRLKKGQRLKTTLRNGDKANTYAGKVGYSEAEGFYFDATVPADPKVLDVVRSGQTLVIEAPGKTETVPLNGVADPLRQFDAACFRKR